MKKIFLLLALQVVLFLSAEAQVLNVNNNEQLYDQWCWAGSSKTVLDYYGFVKQQCDIAEWVRTTATFHSFGTVACCTDATQGCNYWNYNYGSAGSIQDILVHFGNLQNTGIASSLTQAEIITEIQNNRLFVIRWGWSTGGGHFIVGHGISGNNIYFMNPWFGEGLHIGTYNFMLSGVDNTSTATHTWTHTNKITSNVSTGISQPSGAENNSISAFPNPFNSSVNFTYTLAEDLDVKINIYNVVGQLIYQNDMGKQSVGDHLITWEGKNNSSADIPAGVYYLHVNTSQGMLKSIPLVKM